MRDHFKNIHIGSLIQQRVAELEIEIQRITNFFKCNNDEIEQMFRQKELTTDILLKWSKLLDYDFFRVYSQHLILYAPPANTNYNDTPKQKKSILPQFRKNVYTREVIDFIMEMIENGEKTKHQVIEEYKIPKTTLYKWISKYNTRK
ncbi:transposase [Epilithonimonas sp.]|uniref:transposase n=1 Tax=Epilithonimonas sp. TaxID=2894511 RepID=UPI00289B8BEC|nr:transposase [Epilithonimonas sp.]